jgi:putative transposase
MFLDRLSDLLKETQTQCYAWSLLPNHLHLLLNPTRFLLSVLMRRLLTGYVVRFNLRHHRAGHLFQNRYKSIVCEEEPYLLELIRYIHLNPIRAGLVEDLEGLDGYPWSGHSVLMGRRPMEGQELDSVLQHFGGNPVAARRKCREFIPEGVEIGRRAELVGGTHSTGKKLPWPQRPRSNMQGGV